MTSLDSKVEAYYSLPKSEEEIQLEDKHNELKKAAKKFNIVKQLMDIYFKAIGEYKSTAKSNEKTNETDLKRYIIYKCSEFLESYVKIENDFIVLRKTAERFGILDQLRDIEDKALKDYNLKNKHNGDVNYLESKKYAFKECDKFIEEQFKRQEIDDFIKDEKEFREKQLELPLNLKRSFSYQHQI